MGEILEHVANESSHPDCVESRKKIRKFEIELGELYAKHTGKKNAEHLGEEELAKIGRDLRSGEFGEEGEQFLAIDRSKQYYAIDLLEAERIKLKNLARPEASGNFWEEIRNKNRIKLIKTKLSTQKCPLSEQEKEAFVGEIAQADESTALKFLRDILKGKDSISEKDRDSFISIIESAMKVKNPGRLPSSAKGKWIYPGPPEKPAPRGDGYFVPNPGLKLHDILKEYNLEVNGIEFVDGHPNFLPFAQTVNGEPVQVKIDMTGDRQKDGGRAIKALRAQYPSLSDDEIKSMLSGYTWHHEPDGTTMTLVRSDVHHATEKGCGVAHVGGDYQVSQLRY